MSPHLSTELFREIAGHLSKPEDIGTLQAASLASSALLGPCQEKIFSRITVNMIYDSDDDPHEMGIEILRQNSTLLTYVNSTLLTYVKEVNVQYASDYSCPPYDLVPPDEPMVDLIHLLATPLIETFSFRGWSGMLTPAFQQAIIGLVRSPRLTSLTLVTAPRQLVSIVESPFLKHLTLVDAGTPWTNTRQITKSMTCCIHPTSLYITPDEATVSFLTDTNAVGMGAVEELRLSYCKSRVDWLLLLTHATSLRRLYIDVEAIAPGRLGTALKASLSSLAKLEELEIGWTEDGRPHGVNQHAALALFLTALPSPSSISLIKIEYIFQSNTHPEQGTDFWDEADAALCDRRMFPKLKQLEVEIFFLDPRIMPPEEKYEEIKERFWLATRRAGVLVNISVT